MDVHTVVPAHLGMAAYHHARGEYAEAVRYGEAGLAIADRSGYVVWAIHRLLPIIAESYLLMPDFEGSRRVGKRLRRDAERMQHRLGLAWADAADALQQWFEGDHEGAIDTLRVAAEKLEAVPFVPDAARVRRQLAWRLRDLGREEEAIRELRRVHDVFAALGAARELAKTREHMRELGTRPPTRAAGAGVEGLTGREVEIIRLVAARKSNKAIGKALGISPRTVGTHLSNIFRKLSLESRGELTDFARRMSLPD